MARIQKILVAYDGSTQSKEALDWAIDLSLASKAQICVAKVIEAMSIGEMTALYESGSSDDLVAYLEEVKETDRKLMEEKRDEMIHFVKNRL